jgi:hypothetical protein
MTTRLQAKHTLWGKRFQIGYSTTNQIILFSSLPWNHYDSNKNVLQYCTYKRGQFNEFFSQILPHPGKRGGKFSFNEYKSSIFI